MAVSLRSRRHKEQVGPCGGMKKPKTTPPKRRLCLQPMSPVGTCPDIKFQRALSNLPGAQNPAPGFAFRAQEFNVEPLGQWGVCGWMGGRVRSVMVGLLYFLFHVSWGRHT
jgi:hypothetical protein